MKRALESTLRHAGPAGLARYLHRDRPLILAYHDVAPDELEPAGDVSLHLSRGGFAAQMDELVAHFDVRPLAELLAGNAGRGERPRVAITFDDAYAGALTLGLRELELRGIPATVFVAPAYVGGGGGFWWDALGSADTDGMPAELRHFALTTLRGRETEVRRWAAQHAEGRPVPPAFRAASEAELAAAAASGLIRFGSHTWSHPNLTALREDEVDEELARPLAWLRERFPDVAEPWLSYPYGLHSPAVERAAERTGYTAGFAIAGGRVDPDRLERFRLPRLNVPAGISRNGFVLRAAGLIRS